MGPSPPRHRSGQQGLPRPGRTDEENPLRNLTAEHLELLGVPQKLHNLLKLFLGLVHSCDIVEGGFGFILDIEFGPAPAHREKPLGRSHPLVEDPEEKEQNQQGKHPDEEIPEPRCLRRPHELDPLLL